MAETKRKRLSGPAAMRAAGKHPVMVPVSDVEAVRRAAAAEGRSVANFLDYHGQQAAKKILDKISKSH